MCIVHCVITGVFVKVYQAYSSSELCEFILPLFERTCSGSGNGCLEIVVPETVKGDTAILKISLQILVSPVYLERVGVLMPQYQGSKMVIKYESVKLLKKENYLLVQTDKGQYKAKDTVKFRVLALDHDLR